MTAIRIGVIGAGICGAATAHRLRVLLGDHAEILVVDRERRTGGRMHSVAFGGALVEGGASVFHSGNRLLAHYAKMLGLHVTAAAAASSTVGVWDGSRFVFRTHGASRRDSLATLVRYRTGLVRLSRLTLSAAGLLDGVYSMLDAGACWPDALQLLGSAGLEALTSVTAADYLERHHCTGPPVRNYVDPVMRSRYGRPSEEINALAGLAALAGDGLSGAETLRVREGNDAVCRGLLERAAADVRFGTEVRRVVPCGPGWTFELSARNRLHADAAVLAAPVDAGGVARSRPAARDAPRVHVTLVRGELRETCFGRMVPPDLLLTTSKHEPFLSLESVRPGVFKLVSDGRMPERVLGGLFRTVTERREFTWDAPPAPVPTDVRSAFTLAPRLYDATALEPFISTMETQAVAGEAVANLLVSQL